MLTVASPERRWRAATAPLIAALITWFVTGSIHLRRSGPPVVGLATTTRIGITCVAVAAGVLVAVRIMRTHLSVSDDGLVDHRLLRTIRVPWQLISGFDVNRPAGPWGGMCVRAVCRDQSVVDLLATRAYSWLPSASHLDELERLRWSLEDAAKRHADDVS